MINISEKVLRDLTKILIEIMKQTDYWDDRRMVIEDILKEFCQFCGRTLNGEKCNCENEE